MNPTIAPLTVLDAVNRCLAAIGEPSVNTLDGAALDAQSALHTLTFTSQDIQSRGWHWNREMHTIAPDLLGHIILPVNTLSVDTIENDKPTDIITRGTRLFNRKTSAYEFDRPLRVEIIVNLEWDELPYPARRYITALAACRFQTSELGDGNLSRELQLEEKAAWVDLRQHETSSADFNVLKTPQTLYNLRRTF